MNRILRLLVLAVLLLGLSGCTVRFVYNQLDWLAPWYLRNYVTLDDAQRAMLDERLAVRLDWHCSSELPRYAQWLRSVEADLRAGEVSAQRLSAHLEVAEIFLRSLGSRLPPDAAALLVTFSDVQIEELFENLEDRLADNRKEFVDKPAEVLQQERAERIERRLRRWLGRLNTAQQARLEAWSVGLAPFGEPWLENRARWQADLREAIEGLRHDPLALEARLETLLVYPERGWSEEYRTRMDFNREQTLALLVDLYRLSSERQRERLISRIGSLARDFERLSCAVETAA
ncbi:conserved hypothetical protein [Thioalkalivibrio sulfidiphilus HL-EbGr7]|uniref:Lipoprotein n=1 Tax=Thioalkalivibrio sulfidiphilus (strain HL-EbGR7) TaxID=396588 RepID=B8GLS9_THISH|nr:DUF6279 family lipoprotein [Thioalkalivibrio sulfidiphilus]ACL71682.1 conserved hypothetical protein [Thioalkalivibrio sulfidiphilus HL-EbGr7]